MNHTTTVGGSKPYHARCSCGRIHTTDTKAEAAAINRAHQNDPNAIVLIVPHRGETRLWCGVGHGWTDSTDRPETAERIANRHIATFHQSPERNPR